ncbi:MAG TPA: hypothetical protein DCR20_14185 [Planctomycetaceae bacterium]|nr:hypothetical protein [Planctomycetaceae bacterium]
MADSGVAVSMRAATLPSARFQTRTDLSAELDRMRVPVGSNCSAVMVSVWPCRVSPGAPSCRLNRRMA